MRFALLTAAALAVLSLAGTAAAGGWATVGVSPLPTGTEAGGTWTPTLTILQHGKTPLNDVRPSITIRNEATGEMQTFVAARAKGAGTYTADVTFPAAGTWSFTIDDGFSRVHTFKPVEIAATGAAASAGASDGRSPIWFVLAAALAVALAALLTKRLRAARVDATLPARSG